MARVRPVTGRPGVRLAGVEAIAAEGFEPSPRLVGMGVLPLEFMPGTNRKTLQIDGSEEPTT